MHLRTTLSVNKSLTLFNHSTHFLTMGSCFAEETAKLLQANKFKVCSPFGTSFNPESIAQLLTATCNNAYENILPVKQNDVWLDYRFHSSLFGYNEQELYDKIKQAITQAHQQLQHERPVCILTLGTAWVYKHIASQHVVANCHKQPRELFQKELLSLESMKEQMRASLTQLFQYSPGCTVILTLSPVRHLKDGLEDNQVSKSLLRILCHWLSDQFTNVLYFPSYELQLDDLRDYRFYTKDLIHPNELAIEYIWDKFCYAFFEETTLHLLSQWQKISLQLNHRPLHDRSHAYQKFLEHTLHELLQLNVSLDVKEEIQKLQQQIDHLSHES